MHLLLTSWESCQLEKGANEQVGGYLLPAQSFSVLPHEGVNAADWGPVLDENYALVFSLPRRLVFISLAVLLG